MRTQIETRLAVARSAMIAATGEPELYRYFRNEVAQLTAEAEIAAEVEAEAGMVSTWTGAHFTDIDSDDCSAAWLAEYNDEIWS